MSLKTTSQRKLTVSRLNSTNAATYVTSGLTLYFDAGNTNSYPGSGTTWYDLSANSTNGTLVNGVGYNSANNGSLVFDGVDDYVSASNTNLVHRTSNWTYSCWLKFSALSSAGTIFTNGVWTSCLLFRFETNGITVYSMSGTWGKFSLTPTLGTWYKFDFIRNGNTVYFYLNGSYSQSFSFTADIQPSSTFYIGIHAPGECFNGNIAQVAIYNKALSTLEIDQNYNAFKGRFGL